MKFEIKEKTKKDYDAIECLHEKFGSGVHLIKDKVLGNYSIMIIVNNNKSALFVDKHNRVTYIKPIDNKLKYTTFNLHTEYIKKLESEEILIKVEDL